MKILQPKYKQVKVLMAHCPDCGELLQGNNSLAHPWCCKCGEWNHVQPITNNIDHYEVKP